MRNIFSTCTILHVHVALSYPLVLQLVLKTINVYTILKLVIIIPWAVKGLEWYERYNVISNLLIVQ